ncbi:MAG TPA: DNA cytosine methyltransferase [Candidatus Limisoma gallistercoris]|nr:DNA cytosine methyltransferase [Candidatus Limisoma gallistercoris]
MNTEESKDFYSIQEVAEKLYLSVKSVRRYIASGNLNSIKIGGAYRISSGALEQFINDGSKNKNIHYDLFGNIVVDKLAKKKNDIVNWVDIKSFWDNIGASDMTFVDLFCGAGGLSKGLEMAGLNGICGLDWFEEAGMTYRRNFKHPFVNGDIKLKETKEFFYDTVKKQLNGRKLNIVAGGFPCQGFSLAGNRIVDDPRNSLYLEMLEIVNKLQPDFVVCENVKGLRSMLGGRVERKILEDYKAIGYDMNVTTLCAADYYTPQKRERVIFIGNRIGLKNYYPKPILQPSEYITTGESISDLMNHPVDEAFNHVPTKHRPDMEEKMRLLPEGKSLYKGYSDAWKKCPWNEASCTIKENHGGVNIHPKLPRVLTAREMARLQSFPDDFIFMGAKNKQLVQIGNAVPCLLGKAIGIAVRYSNGDIKKDA